MNLFITTGRLTRDPETRVTQSGTSICSFSIAVDRRRKQEGQPTADFFNVTAFGKLGDNCAQYLAKGRKVAVTGTVQNRSYEKDGVKHTVTDVIADSVEFLSPSEKAAPYGATPADEEECPF